MPDQPDFGSWTPRQLAAAENAAIEFLNQNINGIADVFDKRASLIRRVITMMRSGDATFEERMMYLSLLQEIAASVSESARDFFEIGCVPHVAHIVRD
jgi:catabolite regulation protein CreA